jgi:hypothetical protein
MRIGRLSIAVIGLLASGAAFAGAPGWSVSETSGQVSVASTGIVKVASRGGAVAVGDVVSTGRNGRAVLVRGEEYLVVSPNSRIRVADPAKTGGLTQIIENFGNVIYKIKKMTMPHFAVETPFLAAVVKGTTFSVTVTGKGASVQVIEGRVEVATRDGGASFLVLPGDIGSVSATAPARLNVQGRETKSIDSPTPEKAAAAVTASIDDSAAQVAEVDAVRFDGAIDVAIGEGPVKLDAMSDGMVKGDSALVAVIASTAQGAAQAETPTTAPATLAASTQMAPLNAEAETVPEPLPPTPVVDPLPAPVSPKPVIIVTSGPPVQAVIGKPSPAPLPPTVNDPAPTPAPEVVPVALPPVIIVAGADPVIIASPPTPAPTPAPVTVAASTPVAAPSPTGNSNSGSGNTNSNNSGSGNNNQNYANRWVSWLTQQINNRRGN